MAWSIRRMIESKLKELGVLDDSTTWIKEVEDLKAWELWEVMSKSKFEPFVLG